MVLLKVLSMSLANLDREFTLVSNRWNQTLCLVPSRPLRNGVNPPVGCQSKAGLIKDLVRAWQT